MSFPTIVDVALGLITVYLILALLVSELQELLATILEWRAKSLRVAIITLLDGDPNSQFGENLTKLLYKNSLIQSLNHQGQWQRKVLGESKGPSYLASEIFTEVLLNVLKKEEKYKILWDIDDDFKKLADKINNSSTLPLNLRDNLQMLALEAASELKQGEQFLLKFKQEISTWFDLSMERASGVYRRNARGVSLLISLFIASTINVDPYIVVRELSQDRALQAVIVDVAGQLSSGNEPCFNSATPQEECVLNLKQNVNALMTDVSTLPIGWHLLGTIPEEIVENWQIVIWKTLMWCASAIALSMGAPFWFDLLSKVIHVRNTGNRLKD